jgi:hypothetical protein
MKARELDFDTIREINLSTESLKPGSDATPLPYVGVTFIFTGECGLPSSPDQPERF